jgi:hypothetical protein
MRRRKRLEEVNSAAAVIEGAETTEQSQHLLLTLIVPPLLLFGIGQRSARSCCKRSQPEILSFHGYPPAITNSLAVPAMV